MGGIHDFCIDMKTRAQMSELAAMDRNESAIAAAKALEAGRALLAKVTGVSGKREGAKVAMHALGGVIANPAEFWAGACVLEAGKGADDLAALCHSIDYASARLAVGDYDFARQSLIGQSQWLSVLAVKLSARAEDETRQDKATPLYKLAMQAQRQAVQALATAAALNKLEGADCVGISED